MTQPSKSLVTSAGQSPATTQIVGRDEGSPEAVYSAANPLLANLAP